MEKRVTLGYHRKNLKNIILKFLIFFRVQTSKNRLYAFLMESSSLEYEIEKNCDLKQVGNWLDNKGYGIAMPVSKNANISINFY